MSYFLTRVDLRTNVFVAMNLKVDHMVATSSSRRRHLRHDEVTK